MNIKKYFIAICGFFMLATVTPDLAQAQWSIGASYEIRSEDPKNGFGARIERKILTGLPLVQLGLRGHFSYFSEENNISEGGVSYSADVTNYDFGLAATGGVNLGLLTPYVGLGLGSTTFDVSTQDFPSGDFDTSDSAVFWNTFVGAELGVTPILKPFVEYRFQQSDEPEFATEFDANGRLIFGISLAF
ncbi:MAG: outer membrane beta-barrel protein [Balneolaceae bacterium]|nr:outer membrane beta-barrel protein [Balneolaceae bacterium]